MVAFIIFWAALFCVILFLLGTVFKGLASLFTGFISSGTTVVGLAILVGLGEAALFAIYAIANGIRTSGIGEVIGMIVLLVIELAIMGALIGGLGSLILSIIIPVLGLVFGFISNVLEEAAVNCEKAYVHFLMVIIKRLNKC